MLLSLAGLPEGRNTLLFLSVALFLAELLLGAWMDLGLSWSQGSYGHCLTFLMSWRLTARDYLLGPTSTG